MSKLFGMLSSLSLPLSLPEILNAEHYWSARWLFEKLLALLYLIAFVSSLNQFPALLGAKGLLPTPQFVERISFHQSPSVFHWYYSDNFFKIVVWTGILLSLGTLIGIFARGPVLLPMLVWLTLYFVYLSIVNVGQDFYSFGWESMLLEAGFFAAFLGPMWMKPSWIPLLILYWMLFRVELGAGLIKMRGDPCWRDLTCLFYHHETQPLPNPLSWFFHRLPPAILKGGVLFSHFVQLIAPFALFLPGPYRAMAGGFIILHQVILIVGGNYSWLNWLTLVLGVLTFSNRELAFLSPSMPSPLAPRPLWYEGILCLLALATAMMSVRPGLNLLSKNQYMNYSWNRYHLVGAYGAFGSMTRKRYEIVIEGTQGTREAVLAGKTEWREYSFKAKPVDLSRVPPQVAPYHLRLDWLMWFLPFHVQVHEGRLYKSGYEMWFVRFIEKLLQGDKQVLSLLRSAPFPGQSDQKATFIRGRYYLYEFTRQDERRQSGNWWKRTLVGEYLPPVSLQDFRRP